MNTRSAREYTMFAPAQLLRNWYEQWPNIKGDLDPSVTVEVGGVYYTGGHIYDFNFIMKCVIVVGLLFKRCTLSEDLLRLESIDGLL
jgi:hypothetical protein